MRISFYANLDQLLLNYDAECDSWIQQAAATVSLHDFASRIRSSLYDVDYVRKQVSFSYRVNEDVVNNPLGDAAVDTISEMARNSLRDFQYSMSNGSKFTRKSLRYVTNIKEKLIQMAVLDSFIQPAIDSIDAFESSLPKRRAAQLDATELSKMMGLLTLLSDPIYLSSLRTAKFEIEEEEDPTVAPSSVTTSKDNFLTGMLAAISTTSNTPPTQVAGFY